MKTYFVTYKENGRLKKAKLSEDNYQKLCGRGNICEIVTYTDERLMEQCYGQLTCPDGKCDNRKMLRD